MDQFSLTPFDDRYLKIPYEYMEFKYLHYMEKPSPEMKRAWYHEKKAEEKEKKDFEEKNKSAEKQLESSYGVANAKEIFELMRNAK